MGFFIMMFIVTLVACILLYMLFTSFKVPTRGGYESSSDVSKRRGPAKRLSISSASRR